MHFNIACYGRRRAFMENNKKLDWKMLWSLFTTFFKIGAFTFGGGYAMIPIIEREIVDGKGWISREDVVDMLAVSQSLPGVIAINSATFVGTKIGGFIGAVAATIGVVLPSIIIITIIAAFFMTFKDNPVVVKVFSGVKAATVALIAIAVIDIWGSSVKDYIGIIIAAVVFMLTGLLNVNAIYMIIGGIAAGLIITAFRRNAGEDGR